MLKSWMRDGLLVLLALAAATPVQAQALDAIYPNLKKCTTLNCEAVAFRARINGFDTNIDPYLAIVGVSAVGCLRVQVTQATADLQLTVVAPNGLTYFNDNQGSSANPLVVIPLTQAGQYTIALSQTATTAIEAGASVSAGWYTPASNRNCFPRSLGR